MHGAVWTYVLAISIAPLPLQMYNNANGVCWTIASYPYGCKDSLTYGADATCTRGDNAWVFEFYSRLLNQCLCSLLVLVILAMVYCVVRRLENTSLKYASAMFNHSDPIQVAPQEQSLEAAIIPKSGYMTLCSRRSGESACSQPSGTLEISAADGRHRALNGKNQRPLPFKRYGI